MTKDKGKETKLVGSLLSVLLTHLIVEKYIMGYV